MSCSHPNLYPGLDADYCSDCGGTFNRMNVLGRIYYEGVTKNHPIDWWIPDTSKKKRKPGRKQKVEAEAQQDQHSIFNYEEA